MAKQIPFAAKAVKTDKLVKIMEQLEALKQEFAEVVDEIEADSAKASVVDTLAEALAAVDDAIDGIQDVLE